MHNCRLWSLELTCVMTKYEWLWKAWLTTQSLYWWSCVEYYSEFCQVSIARWSFVRWSREGESACPRMHDFSQSLHKKTASLSAKKNPKPFLAADDFQGSFQLYSRGETNTQFVQIEWFPTRATNSRMFSNNVPLPFDVIPKLLVVLPFHNYFW